jgi:hypothetical protein
VGGAKGVEGGGGCNGGLVGDGRRTAGSASDRSLLVRGNGESRREERDGEKEDGC